MPESIRVPKESLSEFCSTVFEKLGVPPSEARIAAEVLVLADLRDKASHGVARMPRYVDATRIQGRRLAEENRRAHGRQLDYVTS